MTNTVRLLAASTLLAMSLAACGGGGDRPSAGVANPEAACTSNITRLQAALATGGAAANATAAARTAAEDELDEAIDARGERDWDDCLDALEEAFEALNMPRGF